MLQKRSWWSRCGAAHEGCILRPACTHSFIRSSGFRVLVSLSVRGSWKRAATASARVWGDASQHRGRHRQRHVMQAQTCRGVHACTCKCKACMYACRRLPMYVRWCRDRHARRCISMQTDSRQIATYRPEEKLALQTYVQVLHLHQHLRGAHACMRVVRPNDIAALVDRPLFNPKP